MNKIIIKSVGYSQYDIPLISMGDITIERFEELLLSQLGDNQKIKIKTSKFREFFGINSPSTQKLAVQVINQYLKKTHFEMNGGYINLYHENENQDFNNFRITGEIKCYCRLCNMEDKIQSITLTFPNYVSMKCVSCKVKDAYKLIES